MLGLNPLLVKHEVGRAKESSYDLPPNDHAYGHSAAKDQEGARELVHEWRAHKAKKERQSRVPDFRRINREAIKEHVHDARQLAVFRQDHAWTLKPNRERKNFDLAAIVPQDPEKHSFGVKVRPSTPVDSIIKNHFGSEYETHQRGIYQEFKLQREKAGEKIKIRKTKASEGHRFKPPVVVKHEKFCLSKFKNIKGKMNFAEMFGRHKRPKEMLVGEKGAEPVESGQ
jgi:hypothetical protein